MVWGEIWSATAFCSVIIVNVSLHMIPLEVESVSVKPLNAILCCSVTLQLVVQRLVNDWVKTVGLLQMIEGGSYFLTWTTFSLIWMKINRKYFINFHSFSEPHNFSSLQPSFQLYSSTPGCAYLYLTTRAAWIAMMQIQYLFLSEPRQTIHYFVVLFVQAHIPQNLFNWTALRLLWFWLFLVVVPCHIVRFWSLLNFVKCCPWKVDTCGLYRKIASKSYRKCDYCVG